MSDEEVKCLLVAFGTMILTMYVLTAFGGCH